MQLFGSATLLDKYAAVLEVQIDTMGTDEIQLVANVLHWQHELGIAEDGRQSHVKLITATRPEWDWWRLTDKQFLNWNIRHALLLLFFVQIDGQLNTLRSHLTANTLGIRELFEPVEATAAILSAFLFANREALQEAVARRARTLHQILHCLVFIVWLTQRAIGLTDGRVKRVSQLIELVDEFLVGGNRGLA